MPGKTVTLTGTPQTAQDAATKAYVDAQDAILGGAMNAVDYGALAWTSDPQVTGTIATTVGSVYATVFRAAASGVCTKMWMHCSVLQTTPTGVFVGLFDMSGNQLGISATAHLAFQTSGQKSIPLLTSVNLVAGQKYVAAWLCVGGTSPTIVTSFGSTSPSLSQTVSNTAPLRQMKTSSVVRTAFTNPEVWTGYAVVGNAPLALMSV